MLNVLEPWDCGHSMRMRGGGPTIQWIEYLQATNVLKIHILITCYKPTSLSTCGTKKVRVQEYSSNFE